MLMFEAEYLKDKLTDCLHSPGALGQIYNQEKKKRNIYKIDFLIFIIIKIHHVIYQIKHNWINFMVVKTVSKNILR